MQTNCAKTPFFYFQFTLTGKKKIIFHHLESHMTFSSTSRNRDNKYPLQSNLVHFGPIRSTSVQFSLLGLYGPVQSNLIRFSPLWFIRSSQVKLSPIQSIYSNLVHFGSFGPIQFGPLQSILGEYKLKINKIFYFYDLYLLKLMKMTWFFKQERNLILQLDLEYQYFIIIWI